MDLAAGRKKRCTFVVCDIKNSVKDFCRTYGGNLPQIVRVKKGRKADEKTVKKSQVMFTFFKFRGNVAGALIMIKCYFYLHELIMLKFVMRFSTSLLQSTSNLR